MDRRRRSTSRGRRSSRARRATRTASRSTWEGEDGAVRRLTNAELRDAVARRRRGSSPASASARATGSGSSCRCCPRPSSRSSRSSRLGAIFTPIFSGYAAPAIAARLADCEATLLITADGFLRRGAWVDLKSVADAAVAQAPSVERVLVVRRAGDALAVPWTRADGTSGGTIGHGGTGGRAGSTGRRTATPRRPYMIIYTSGTTGRPKGAVHVHGGFPIKAAQDLAHTFDLDRRDALFWFTDLGWMMGPWAIAGALLLGARLVLYEGAPDFPGPDRLWEIVARHRVTHLGLSPTVIRALMAHGEEPVRAHDRSSLRVLGSTGEPWNPEPWWWFFREVGEGRCPIVNYSRRHGGRRAASSAATSSAPIKPASFSGPCIGTAADVVDDDRRARARRGRRARHPRAAAGHDPRLLARPRSATRRRTGRAGPGIWVHGDWASIDADGFWYIHGRSDDTLKVAGKRVGPAEVESAAVGASGGRSRRPRSASRTTIKGEAIVVLCVLRPGETDDDELRGAIARDASPTSSASRSSPRSSPSSRPCPRPARARSCAASSGRPGSASTRATCRRSTIRDSRSRRSGPYPRVDEPRSTAPERDIVSWEDLDRLVGELAERLAGRRFDVMLAITRGGMVPAGMLAYRLRLRDILVAAVEYYDDSGQPGPQPTFLQFPADPLLRGKRVLIVDEVWDSGTTIHAVTERVRQAGG